MPESTIRETIKEEFEKNEANKTGSVTGAMIWKVLAGFFVTLTTAISIMWLRSESNHDKNEAYWKEQYRLKDSALSKALLEGQARGEKYFDYYQKEIEINRDLIEGASQSIDTMKRRQYNFLRNHK